jgi:23S rRNA pseudouridine1911/1915/1917 synthase
MEEVKIIYEDDNFMVLDKPAGMVTTNENSKLKIQTSKLKTQNLEQLSLEDWVKNNRENNLLRQGIVHRLDKGTSGIVIVAKTEESLIDLKRQFKERKVKKRYMAMVCGNLPFSGEVDMPIARSKYSFGRFRVDESGKRAQTIFRLVEKYMIEGKMYSLVDIDLKTGRTHQIRVHFSYLGWPLLGDKTYGGLMVGLDRPFLHAYQTEINGQVFKSELAPDIKLMLEKYETI